MTGARFDTVTMARELYTEGPRLIRTLQHLRPRILPFEMIHDAVPQGARVLDVGCGGGLVLGLLAKAGRVREAVGFDSSADAIAIAQGMTRNLAQGVSLDFRHLPVNAPWPEGPFDAVMIVDVIHHIPPAAQEAVLAQAAAVLRPGGRMIYKDMGQRPGWMALANRLHDLVIARDWIHYLPLERARRAMDGAGLTVRDEQAASLLWYRHEMLVADAPAA
ncbi:MAG: class I SAM-dependent methyltransferase [Pseudomonadota bacterium]